MRYCHRTRGLGDLDDIGFGGPVEIGEFFVLAGLSCLGVVMIFLGSFFRVWRERKSVFPRLYASHTVKRTNKEA